MPYREIGFIVEGEVYCPHCFTKPEPDPDDHPQDYPDPDYDTIYSWNETPDEGYYCRDCNEAIMERPCPPLIHALLADSGRELERNQYNRGCAPNDIQELFKEHQVDGVAWWINDGWHLHGEEGVVAVAREFCP